MATATVEPTVNRILKAFAVLEQERSMVRMNSHSTWLSCSKPSTAYLFEAKGASTLATVLVDPAR
jgi:hypothetical protein